MRLFVLFPDLLACFVLHAQPTIGTADLPQGGTVYLRANAVPPFNADDIEVDAWGTLLLPGGEFDCLRVKRTFSALDTINVAAADIGFTRPREGTVYEWYAPGEDMPVLSVQTFIDIPAIWQYKPGETDAVAESAPVDWKLGPSPLQLGAPLHCPGLAGRDLLVTDAMGRTLFRGQPAVTGTLATLDTKGWTNGMVVVTDLNSGRSARVVIR